MTSVVLREVATEKARRVRQIEIVDALMARPGEQFTLAGLATRFGSTAKALTKIADRAAESALIRKGRDIAGEIVYWAPTATERAFGSRTKNDDLKGYADYLRSHWRLAESVQWERR